MLWRVVMASCGSMPVRPEELSRSSTSRTPKGNLPIDAAVVARRFEEMSAAAEAAITSKTKAIVAVETFGHPGGMIELEQFAQSRELLLIEDSCEGFGGHAGNEQDE